MRRIGFGSAAVAVGLLLGAGLPEPGGDDSSQVVQEELARFQGTWQLVSAEADGVKAPKDRTDKIRVVIKGSRHTVMFGDQEVVHSVPFAIDPTTTPKSVTDTLVDGPDKGKQIKGIYKLEGDTMTSCVAKVGEERPTEFASKPGTGHTLRVFRRVKDVDDAKAKAVEAELKRFEGTWRFESLVVEGREVPPEGLKTTRLTLKGDTFEMTDPMATYRGTFTLDLGRDAQADRHGLHGRPGGGQGRPWHLRTGRGHVQGLRRADGPWAARGSSPASPEAATPSKC